MASNTARMAETTNYVFINIKKLHRIQVRCTKRWELLGLCAYHHFYYWAQHRNTTYEGYYKKFLDFVKDLPKCSSTYQVELEEGRVTKAYETLLTFKTDTYRCLNEQETADLVYALQLIVITYRQRSVNYSSSRILHRFSLDKTKDMLQDYAKHVKLSEEIDFNNFGLDYAYTMPILETLWKKGKFDGKEFRSKTKAKFLSKLGLMYSWMKKAE